MLHARDDYIDSRFIEHYATFHMPEIVDPLINKSRFNHQSTHHEARCNGSVMRSSITQQLAGTGETVALLDQELLHPNPHYLILSQRCLSANEYNEDHQGLRMDTDSESQLTFSHPTLQQSFNVTPSSLACSISDMCKCSQYQYGSIRRGPPIFQGELFVLNERNYFI